jgi:hypothetical protein
MSGNHCPQDAIFAMGDNRKGSSDSREIGFAPIKDIRLVLPLEKQKGKLDRIGTTQPMINQTR